MRKPYKLTPDVCSKILDEYTQTTVTLVELSKMYGINKVTLSNFLKLNGVTIRRTGARPGHTVKPSTREKFSKIHKGNSYSLGRKQTDLTKLKLISANTGIPLSEIVEYNSYEKLRLLVSWAGTKRTLFDQSIESKIQFIRHFYYSQQFNRVFDSWIAHDKKHLWKPSIDHIVPFSRGGTGTIENLQVITWFENKIKDSMTESEWQIFKEQTNTSSDLFIR